MTAAPPPPAPRPPDLPDDLSTPLYPDDRPRRVFLAGEWVAGEGRPIESRFPADGTLTATVPGASAAQVDAAVKAGRAAMADPGWRDLKPHERARALHAISDELSRRAERIARVQTRDTGKTLAETRALVASAAATFRFMAAACETLEDQLTPPRGDYLTMSVHEPIGVVAAITPWNSPIASDAQKVAPGARRRQRGGAEALGLVAAGLPGAGGGDRGGGPAQGPVLGIARQRRRRGRGAGDASGRRHRQLHRRHRHRSAHRREGGGEADAGVAGTGRQVAHRGLRRRRSGPCAGRRAVRASSPPPGRAASPGSRLYVERPVHDRFVERLVERTKALRVGHPHDPATQVAPLITPEHRASVEAYVDLARQEGGEILAGGARPEGPDFDAGSYYLPTVVAGLPDAARISREEIFGPVLVVLPFDDEDDLIARANDSVYGLAAGIWSADYRRIWRVARRLEAGTVWINTYKQFSISTPFGGMKDSGLGREKGREGIPPLYAPEEPLLEPGGKALAVGGVRRVRKATKNCHTREGGHLCGKCTPAETRAVHPDPRLCGDDARG